MASRFYSKRSPEVWLAVGKLAWSQLPLSLKSRFLDGLERIATLRDQIGAAAAVSSMPPIQVIPELWYDDDSTSGIRPIIGTARLSQECHVARAGTNARRRPALDT